MARNSATGKKKAVEKTSAKHSGSPGEADRVPRRMSRKAAVRKMIDRLVAEMDSSKGTPRVNEFVRLLAIEKELGGEKETAVREIRVTWVEPKTTESSKSK